MTATDNSTKYWSVMDVSRYWSFPPPLVPAKADADIYAAEAGKWQASTHPPRVLVLGATPALHGLPWQEGTELLAADRSEYMLKNLWPGGAETTRHEDWIALSLRDASRDIAFTDLGLMFVAYPRALTRLAVRLGRVVAPGGLFITRHVWAADAREDFDDVMREFTAGAVGNSSILKLRLAMALARGTDGVQLADIWERYDQSVPDRSRLPASTGWSSTELSMIESYRNAEDVYYYPSPGEVARIFAEGGFELYSEHTPGYLLGERFRFLTFRRR